MTHSRLFTTKSTGDFVLESHKPHSECGLNDTRVMTKVKKPSSKYYVKMPASAICEVIAKELARLICPEWQPKARLITDATGLEYVGTKEVPAFKSLSDIDPLTLFNLLNENKLTGLGFICVFSLVLNETDLHTNNIGKDQENNIVYIDADYAFYRYQQSDLSDANQNRITTEDLNALPSLRTYKPSNWLFTYYHDKHIHDDKNPLSFLKHNTRFQREVNQACLYFMLLSSSLIDEFFESYCQNKSILDDLKNELQNRISQLSSAAMNRPSFRQYLLSDDASNDARLFGIQVQNFKTAKKRRLITSENDITYIDIKLNQLRESLSNRAELTSNKCPPKHQSIKSIDDIISRLNNRSSQPHSQQLSNDNALRKVIIRFISVKPYDQDSLNRILDAAYESRFTQFGELYYELCNAYNIEYSILGPYRLLLSYFKIFVNPDSSDTSIIQSAKDIETFLKENSRLFFRHTSVDTISSTLSTNLGQRLAWGQNINTSNLDKMIKLSSHPIVAKVLLRLGGTSAIIPIHNVTLEDMQDVIQNWIFIFDFKDVYTGKVLHTIPPHYFFSELKKRNLLSKPVKFNDIQAIEEYISQHIIYLAYPELSAMTYTNFHSAIRECYHSCPDMARQFLFDFFFNPEYEFGIFRLKKIRVIFVPHEQGNTCVDNRFSKFYSSYSYDTKRVFHFNRFKYSNELETNALFKLFSEFMPPNTAFHTCLNFIDQNFHIESYLLNILYISDSPYRAGYSKQDWSDLAENLFYDMLIPYHIRIQLLSILIKDGQCSRAQLDLEDVTGILLSFFSEIYDSLISDDSIMNILRLLRFVSSNTKQVSEWTYNIVFDFLNNLPDRINRQAIDEIKQCVRSKQIICEFNINTFFETNSPDNQAESPSSTCLRL